MDVLRLYPVRQVLHNYTSDDDAINLAVVLGDPWILNDQMVSKFFGKKEALLQTSDSMLDLIPDDRLNRCLTEATCDESFLERVFPRIHWKDITPYVKNRLTEEFMVRHGNELSWEYLCRFQSLSNVLLMSYGDKVLLDDLVVYQPLHQEFHELYFNFIKNRMLVGSNDKTYKEVLMGLLCVFQELSDEFILKHVEELDYNLLLATQGFMRIVLLVPKTVAIWDHELFEKVEIVRKNRLDPTIKLVDWSAIAFSKPQYTVKDLIECFCPTHFSGKHD